MQTQSAPPRAPAPPGPVRRPTDLRRNIKYESELDPTFSERIASLAYGEKMFSCIQCGTCSGTCPVSHYMDFTPRRIIAMIREGFKEEVLNSLTIWLCASCYSCTCECPREIKITDVMYALKQEALTQGKYPKRFPTPVLAREFFRGVQRTGRNSETQLMVRFFLKTNPFAMIKNTLLALRLWRTGRMPLFEEHVRNPQDIRTLLHASKQAEGGR
jgi:quinone-modifying oxidoreductase, subunit QmoC